MQTSQERGPQQPKTAASSKPRRPRARVQARRPKSQTAVVAASCLGSCYHRVSSSWVFKWLGVCRRPLRRAAQVIGAPTPRAVVGVAIVYYLVMMLVLRSYQDSESGLLKQRSSPFFSLPSPHHSPDNSFTPTASLLVFKAMVGAGDESGDLQLYWHGAMVNCSLWALLAAERNDPAFLPTYEIALAECGWEQRPRTTPLCSFAGSFSPLSQAAFEAICPVVPGESPVPAVMSVVVSNTLWRRIIRWVLSFGAGHAGHREERVVEEQVMDDIEEEQQAAGEEAAIEPSELEFDGLEAAVRAANTEVPDFFELSYEFQVVLVRATDQHATLHNYLFKKSSGPTAGFQVMRAPSWQHAGSFRRIMQDRVASQLESVEGDKHLRELLPDAAHLLLSRHVLANMHTAGYSGLFVAELNPHNAMQNGQLVNLR